MGYLYNKLRDALGGTSVKTGMQIKKWSPNEIRSIVIMREYILIADYLKQPKVIPLDLNEVDVDLRSRGGGSSLNNLLNNRQLSCMEEIYVDSVFMNYKDVFDLEKYVRDMFNQVSRLRYYGYTRAGNAEVLRQFYSNVQINGTMDATIALNIGGFEYNDTGNSDWYKKHNLRPQYYALDSDKGTLHTYFMKCEKQIGEETENKKNTIKTLKTSEKILRMYNTDLQRVQDIKILMSFITFIKGCDDFAKDIAIRVQESMTKHITVSGLSKDMLIQALKIAKIPKDEKGIFLLNLYQKVGVFDESGKEFDPSEDDMNDGIYKFCERLDFALAEANAKCTRKDYMLLYLMTTSRVTEGLPEGKLTDILSRKKLLNCEVTEKGNINGLLRFTYGICGFIKEDFIQRYQEKAKAE